MPKELAINRGYRLFALMKIIIRSVIVFLDVIMNQVGSQVREYVSVVYECICSSTPK